MSIAEIPQFSQTAGLQFAKRHESARVYDFAHLTGRSPCANLGGELNMYVGGTNGESRFKAGAVPQLYSRQTQAASCSRGLSGKPENPHPPVLDDLRGKGSWNQRGSP